MHTDLHTTTIELQVTLIFIALDLSHRGLCSPQISHVSSSEAGLSEYLRIESKSCVTASESVRLPMICGI